MRNLRLKLQYDGRNYHGWQRQDNAVSVQGTLEKAIERLFSEHCTVYGCSRTDAGVHANEYFCNFRTEKNIPCDAVVRALNSYLPYDIAVLDCCEAAEDFHARFDCTSKEYIYKIWNSPVKNPFMSRSMYHYRYKLDEKLLDAAAKAYIGTYDYKAFCASGSSVADTVRTVMKASVSRCGDAVIFTVEANGFLYNMVRIMAGTLININEGKIDSNSLRTIILSGDRTLAGVTAPPEGLYLNRVHYHQGIEMTDDG